MENVYYTALYKVAKRLDFLLDFCIEKNREKNLVVWPRLKAWEALSQRYWLFFTSFLLIQGK